MLPPSIDLLLHLAGTLYSSSVAHLMMLPPHVAVLLLGAVTVLCTPVTPLAFGATDLGTPATPLVMAKHME